MTPAYQLLTRKPILRTQDQAGTFHRLIYDLSSETIPVPGTMMRIIWLALALGRSDGRKGMLWIALVLLCLLLLLVSDRYIGLDDPSVLESFSFGAKLRLNAA